MGQQTDRADWIRLHRILSMAVKTYNRPMAEQKNRRRSRQNRWQSRQNKQQQKEKTQKTAEQTEQTWTHNSRPNERFADLRDSTDGFRQYRHSSRHDSWVVTPPPPSNGGLAVHRILQYTTVPTYCTYVARSYFTKMLLQCVHSNIWWYSQGPPPTHKELYLENW